MCGYDAWHDCRSVQGTSIDILQLMEVLSDRLCIDELEQFLVRAWFIWNQRNAMLHGKQMQAPEVLIKRERDFTEEFRRANTQLVASLTTSNPTRWRPPPVAHFKLKFDASIFKDMGGTGIRAIIRNDSGEVMVALLAKGPPVACSEEAEVLACRHAVQFIMECGFTELVIEGDNHSIMFDLSLRKGLSSRFGHIL